MNIPKPDISTFNKHTLAIVISALCLGSVPSITMAASEVAGKTIIARGGVHAGARRPALLAHARAPRAGGGRRDTAVP